MAITIYPGGNNTFVPSYEASGEFQVEFSRNPDSFPLNKYVGFKTVKKSVGYYLQIRAQEAARVVKQEEYLWPDGRDMPMGSDGTEAHKFLPYTTERFAYPYKLGHKAIEQSDWKILASHGRIHAQKAMTARTMRAIDVLSTAANYDGNTATATVAGGGAWSASSASNQYILKTFNYVKEAVHKATLGAVPPDALRCTIGPELAHEIRENEEIRDFVKQNVQAFPALAGSYFFTKWGIPENLYGIKMIVEDSVKVTTRPNVAGSATTAYVLTGGNAIFTTVVEGLENKKEPADGAPTMNTMTLFVYEDMTVESKDDPDNRRTIGRVVDDTAEVLTAPPSGYLITGAM